jgi:hypothetical protein
MSHDPIRHLGTQSVDGEDPSEKIDVERFSVDVPSIGSCHFTLPDGRVLHVVLVPADVSSALKPLVAARAATDSDPYASHLADAGMTAALRAWGAS